MYFIFEAKVQSWKNRILQAELDETLDTSMLFGQEWHWWDAKPSTKALPLFRFAVDPEASQPDNYWTGTTFELYSDQLVSLLHKAGVHFETFSAELISCTTNEVLPFNYQVFHLLEIYPAIDEEKSDIEQADPLMIPEIRKIVLTEACLREKRPLFRDLEYTNFVLIHESLKKELEAAGITGCCYTPVEEFQSGFEALEKALKRIHRTSKST